MNDITIEVNQLQRSVRVNEQLLEQAACSVLQGEGVTQANIRVAIVDDTTIRKANQQYLGHDVPTDVLSFPWTCRVQVGPSGQRGFQSDNGLEGDIMISAETAVREAAAYGWSAGEELMLYLVHGTLHLVGYDDHDEVARAEMRERETHYLRSLGIVARYDRREVASHGRRTV